MLKLRELQEISGPETQEALLFLANYCKDTGALQEAQQYCTSSERPNPWLRRGRTPGSAAAEPLAPPLPSHQSPAAAVRLGWRELSVARNGR